MQLIFKKLFKNSAREIGTLRYFREKSQRRNVTLDVKHFEDCEQLFISVGRCYTVAALLDFFSMDTVHDRPSRNRPPQQHLLVEQTCKQEYYDQTLNKFIDEYLGPAVTEHNITESETSVTELNGNPEDSNENDFVRNYSIQLLQYFFLIADFKDAVKEGNGQQLHQLHKQLLHHFKTDNGFNTYAIEMFVNIIQNEVLLSESEAHQCMWAATANWKGGKGTNIEIDLLQENQNKALKKLIKGMGANKTNKAIERASKAVGGVQKIVENFHCQASVQPSSAAHSHKSSTADELQILEDLRKLKPFTIQAGRAHNSFPNVAADPFNCLDKVAFIKWLARHKKNILYHSPVEEEDNV